MSNHYEILGLKPGASSSEIKAAFRRLAKLFHPDKNPGGREHFTKILRAYEILSDPSLKSSYDYRLYNGLQTENIAKKNPGTKTWNFDEKEMKRRQYYNEHIKKYTKSNAHFATPETKKPYNEYKYILFATPLAVLLFLLIMHLASDPPHSNNTASGQLQEDPDVNFIPKTGDTLYAAYFGGSRFDSLANRKLFVKNNSGSDVIVCLFVSGIFWRSCFISDQTSVSIDGLSKKPVRVLYSSGSEFSIAADTTHPEGFFTGKQHFYKSAQLLRLKPDHVLVLDTGLNANFEEINETDFFADSATHS